MLTAWLNGAVANAILAATVTVTEPTNIDPPHLGATVELTPAEHLEQCAKEMPIRFRIPGDIKAARVFITIENDGTVSHVQMVVPSGDARLDQTALDCVYRWKFSPARSNGAPIKSYKEFQIDFANQSFFNRNR